MRLVTLSKWEFDLPNGAVLTLHDREAAEWIDGLIKEVERLRERNAGLFHALAHVLTNAIPGSMSSEARQAAEKIIDTVRKEARSKK